MVGIFSNQLVDWHHESLGNPFNPAVMPGMFYYWDHKNFWHRLYNTVTFHYWCMIFKYYIHEQDKYVEQYFGTGYPNVIKLQEDFDLMLVNTHLSLNGAVAYTPGVVPVGGIHIEDNDAKLPEVKNFQFFSC